MSWKNSNLKIDTYMATRKVGRVKPTMTKAGVTKNRSRKFCKGGKLYKCGGKIKKRC